VAEKCLWLPTLPDLLEWLEERGFTWVLTRTSRCDCKFILLEKGKGVAGIREDFWADTSEDTAAKAVEWVLEREK